MRAEQALAAANQHAEMRQVAETKLQAALKSIEAMKALMGSDRTVVDLFVEAEERAEKAEAKLSDLDGQLAASRQFWCETQKALEGHAARADVSEAKLREIDKEIDPNASPGGDIIWSVKNYVKNVNEMMGRFDVARSDIEALKSDRKDAYEQRDIALEKWHAHQKNVPCAGCEGGHDTFWKTVTESQQWQDWEDSAASGCWDIDESRECGHISQAHFQAFLAFVASGLCRPRP